MVNNKIIQRLIGAGLVFLSIIQITAICFALEDSDFLIHGFLGQGYILSDDNNYLGDSNRGTWEFNEVGLNLTVPLLDDLRFGVQFFSRDMGFYADNELEVDWAFFDYRYSDWLGLRAGKIKMPYGLYNRQRDADNLRTSILLPQSVYPEGLREFVVAHQGVSIYGSYPLGMVGEVDYEGFIGTLNTSTSNPLLSNMFQMIGYELASRGIDYQTIMIQNGISLDEIDTRIIQIIGGNLIWLTPISGFKIGYTQIQGEGELVAAGQKAVLELPFIRVVSVEYEIGDLVLMAEHFEMEAKLDMSFLLEGFEADVNMEGWYTGAAYHIATWLDLGASYSEYYPLAEDKNGSLIESVGGKDYYAWQKDTTLSVKFNFNEYLSLKFETHFINGVGLCSLNENSGTMEENWMLYVIKTSLNF